MDEEIVRLQEINDDTVLEKTSTVEVKTRISLGALERRREYLTASIAKFQGELDEVDSKIAEVNDEKSKQSKG